MSGGARAEDCDRVVLSRNTAHYREALVLARLILERRAPELRSGAHEVFALLFDMNALWERYVGWLFRRAAPRTCEVVEQEPWTFWQNRPAAPRRVHPDAILRERRTGRNLVAIDAKWKLIGSAGPADDDLKQMFVYNHLLGARQALLVYPCVDAGWSALDGRYVGCDHRCGSLAIGLFEGDGWNTRLLVAQVERALSALSAMLEAQAGSGSAEAS